MQLKRRPWGWFFTILDHSTFKVKILRFHANKSCSFQRHRERSELWMFLKGNGIFSKGYKIETLKSVKAGDHLHVAVKEWHQYIATKPTIVLEIQLGNCREDDIERK